MTEREAYELLCGLPPEVQVANGLERMFDAIRQANKDQHLYVHTERSDGMVRYVFEFYGWVAETRRARQ